MNKKYMYELYMKPIGTKAPKNLFGGKRLNATLKFGSKALGAVGSLALPASFVAPQAAPILEAAGLAGLALSGIQKARQMAKHKKILL